MNSRAFYPPLSFFAAVIAGVLMPILLIGCATTSELQVSDNAETSDHSKTPTSTETPEPPEGADVSQAAKADPALAAASPGQKGSAQLWGELCARCHYARDAATFSQLQWEMIMMHMRIRANLTAAEHRAILDFFKPAH